MELGELDKLFEDPANRVWGVFYHCPADPRVIAPSRPTWRGYQINFAHPRAAYVLLLYLVVLIGPVGVALVFGPEDPVQLAVRAVAVFGVSVGLLLVLSFRLSRRRPPGG